MKTKNKFFLCSFLALASASLILSINRNFVSTKAAGDCWIEEVEDDVTTYRSVKGNCGDEFGTTTQYTLFSESEHNAFEVKIRANEEANNLNVGIHAISGSTNCFFDYRQDMDALRFRLNSPTNWVAYSETIEAPLHTWFTLKMVCDEGIVKCYADGVLKYSISRGDISFNNKFTYTVSAFGCDVSFKEGRAFDEKIDDELVIPSEWKKTVEGSTDVYTLTNGGPSSFYYSGANNGKYNTFSFDARINEMTQDYDGNVGASLLVGANSFFFEYNPAPARSYFRLRYFPAGSAEGEELALSPITLAPFSSYFNIKVVFANEYLAGYINNTLVLFSSETHGENMQKAIAGISAWCTKPSVKNFATSTSKIDYGDVGYVDLEFNDFKAVESFKSYNTSLSYESGNMKINLTGSGAKIISPTINVSRGSMYSMKFPVKNTFCVRMKNNSSASSIKLDFKLKGETETFSKTFPIKPNSDYETYFFNLSDVFDCEEWYDAESLKRCNHYLTDFSFEFLNTSEGTVMLDAITFEREDKLLPYRAENIHIVADKEKETVTVSGQLKEEFAGQTISVLQSEITNYNDLIDWAGNKLLAQEKTNGRDFSLTFSLKQGNNMTHLSTVFLVVASSNNKYLTGYLCSKSSMIENWEDFSSNPYHFDLPNRSINVTDAPYNAKGDAFTNDTHAFQTAIDAISALGGGTINIPGDTSTPYGRRYIISTIRMADNVELHFEDGAILWQSQRDIDYEYDFVKTHDVVIPGVPWTHAAVSKNRPFVWIDNKQNVKLTGNGQLRMADTGTECLDGNRYGGNGDITLNCGKFVHEHPIVAFRSQNIEMTNVAILRNAIWTAPFMACKNVYVGNVQAKETSCINGDGFNFALTEYALADRCTLYSNDDAMIMSSCYYDPRNNHSIVPEAWADNPPSVDTQTGSRFIEVQHCNLFGGHGLTIIPWGSSHPIEQNAEIHDIYVHDNVLGGTSTSVGVWGDNPFHGTSYMETYDQREADDFSPMRDIIIVNNIYTQPCVLATWAGGTTYNATGFICDGGIYSSQQFINGNFDKNIRFETDIGFVTGLANWTPSGDVGTKVVREDLGYSGFIKGTGHLNQGLYTIFGSYELSIKTKLISGTASLKAVDMMNGKVYGESTVETSNDFITSTLSFTIDRPTTVRVGVWHEGENNTEIDIDDASLITHRSEKDFAIEGGKDVTLGNASDFDIYSSTSSNTKIINGNIYTSANAETKIISKNVHAYELSVEADISVSTYYGQNCGFYLFANRASSMADSIDALNIQLESKAGENKYNISLFEFSAEDGYIGTILRSNDLVFSGDMVHLKVVVKNNVLFAFVGNSLDYLFMYELKEEMYGSVGIRSQYQASQISNFKVTYKDYADLSVLTDLINQARGLNLSLYTEATVNALLAELAIAEQLNRYSPQNVVDNECNKLRDCISGLVLKENGGDDDSSSSSTSTSTSSGTSTEPGKKGGCGGNILATSPIIFILSSLGLLLLLKKKRD